jgi:hypothetical protein
MNLLKHATKQARIIFKRLFKAKFLLNYFIIVYLCIGIIVPLYDVRNNLFSSPFPSSFSFSLISILVISSSVMLQACLTAIFITKTYGNKLLELITKLLCIKIDEEGRGYLSDLRSKWINSGLNPNQVKIKELIFIFDHYRGKFIAWIRLPRILSSIKTK